MSITVSDKPRAKNKAKPKANAKPKKASKSDIEIIDAHGHILEPFDFWDDYLDPKFKGRGMTLETNENGVQYMTIDREPSPYTYGISAFLGGTGRNFNDLVEKSFDYFDGPQGAFDADARIAMMDEEGIDRTLIIASAAQLWGALVRDVELNDAYVRAYNNWVVDWCAPHKERLIPAAFLPVLDIDTSIREIKRVAKLGRHKAFLATSSPLNSIGYWDNIYDPLWAAIEDSGIPILYHPALHDHFYGAKWIRGGTNGITDDRYLLFFDATVATMEMGGAIGAMFQGGVFDRFPKLKVVMLEAGAGWIQHFLERHDTKYRRVGSRSPLKMLPSEYFQRQMWIGAEPEETMIPDLIAKYGAERFIWGTDFPHWDALPGTLDSVRAYLKPLKKADQAQVLGKSSITCFNL